MAAAGQIPLAVVTCDLACRLGERCAAPLQRLGLLQRIRIGPAQADGPERDADCAAEGILLTRLSGG
jgi:hypothetical protein